MNVSAPARRKKSRLQLELEEMRRVAPQMFEDEQWTEEQDRPEEETPRDERPLPVSAFRPPVLTPEVEEIPARMAERAELCLGQIGLRYSTYSKLDEAGLMLVGEVLARRPEELTAIPYFGEESLADLYRALARLGFHRKP